MSKSPPFRVVVRKLFTIPKSFSGKIHTHVAVTKRTGGRIRSGESDNRVKVSTENLSYYYPRRNPIGRPGVGEGLPVCTTSWCDVKTYLVGGMPGVRCGATVDARGEERGSRKDDSANQSHVHAGNVMEMYNGFSEDTVILIYIFIIHIYINVQYITHTYTQNSIIRLEE